jgi:homoserine kinase type II
MMTGADDELKDIISRYDIGEIIGWERNDRGYVNTGYAVETWREGARWTYFVKRYHAQKKRSELVFEHSLINHLVANGFASVAPVRQARDGSTFVRGGAGEDGRRAAYYAVFDFLPGEDRYTWVSPACTDRELQNAAAVLAAFHSAVFGFRPDGEKSEAAIVDLLPDIANTLAGYPAQTKHTAFDANLLRELKPILAHLARAQEALGAPEYDALVHCVIHCDYHPGNLRFQSDAIVGLLDFDWSKIDARCFDVALACLYFCATWPGDEPGGLDLRKTAVFLHSYQDALQRGSKIGPLNAVELGCLTHMMCAANLYVLNWTLKDFNTQDVDLQEYLLYQRHSVHIMRWLEKKRNWHALEQTVATACS